MVLALPRPRVGVVAAARQLAAHWRAWVNALRPDSGIVVLPRFTLEQTLGLREPLQALGMGIAFSAAADFSGMGPDGLSISDVRQKTYLSVDEKGTTASAVTSTAIAGAVSPVLLVDRPFLLAIEDTRTGALLFLGAINDPTRSGR